MQKIRDYTSIRAGLRRKKITCQCVFLKSKSMFFLVKYSGLLFKWMNHCINRFYFLFYQNIAAQFNSIFDFDQPENSVSIEMKAREYLNWIHRRIWSDFLREMGLNDQEFLLWFLVRNWIEFSWVFVLNVHEFLVRICVHIHHECSKCFIVISREKLV